MGRFVEAADRHPPSFLPACLEDYVDPDNPVRVIDAFVDELDLAEHGFARVQPASTERPGYGPGTMLKLYVYGYLHQLTSSRKLKREAGRNIELMWLTGRLAPDFKTIADFRHDNASAIQIACQRFVTICRVLGLVGGGVVAIDGSRLRAVNTHEKNYTKGKLARRKAHIEESIARYLAELEDADCAETGPATPRIEHLTERLASLRGRLGELEEIGRQLEASPDQQVSLTDPDARRDGGPPLHRRARLRHHQVLDGRHPLPNARPQERLHRSQPGDPGLQHQAHNRRCRRCLDPQSDNGLSGANTLHRKPSSATRRNEFSHSPGTNADRDSDS
ncbi:Transposase [Mesorhizobium australicum]|uniref:Transposase n=1 Tax=Mesorhizobium australicum TaxID=536018 RepID=A0A1X7NT78_9HYPH|nr:Transposase [Mesorhizobium australicum]